MAGHLAPQGMSCRCVMRGPDWVLFASGSCVLISFSITHAIAACCSTACMQVVPLDFVPSAPWTSVLMEAGNFEGISTCVVGVCFFISFWRWTNNEL